MRPTYLFYDIETTGLNPCFDQVLQFAAIRTDLTLQEIERHEIMIRLSCDVIPHPIAMKTHGISLGKIYEGKNEYEAIQEIHRLMNTPGTISVGYNSLGFDDEFLRFSFYRNLLPPYTHQYANQCGRMDMYPITVLYYLFHSNSIEWPLLNGLPSLKLENINAANNFIKGRAHDAMIDVEVTLELARNFYKHHDSWNYVCGYFSKSIDIKRMNILTEGIAVEGKLGIDNNFLAPVIFLGPHRVYQNQTLWFRLDHSLIENFTEMDAHTTFALRKKWGETPIILPMEERFLSKISTERQQLIHHNKQFFENNKKIFQAIQHYHQHYTYPLIEGVDPDAALYQIPFPTPEEEQLFRKFHHASPQEKQSLIEFFTHPIRKEQALRILGRHYTDVLSAENKTIFSDYLHRIKNEVVVDYKGRTKNK